MTDDPVGRHVIIGLDLYPAGAVLGEIRARGAEVLDVTLDRATIICSSMSVVDDLQRQFPRLTIAPERSY